MHRAVASSAFPAQFPTAPGWLGSTRGQSYAISHLSFIWLAFSPRVPLVPDCCRVTEINLVVTLPISPSSLIMRLGLGLWWIPANHFILPQHPSTCLRLTLSCLACILWVGHLPGHFWSSVCFSHTDIDMVISTTSSVPHTPCAF